MANPYKARIIAEAKIKNDRMDARVLADLVRADLVAESYVPDAEIREQRALQVKGSQRIIHSMGT